MGSATSVPLESRTVISATGAQAGHTRRNFSFSAPRTAPVDRADQIEPVQEKVASTVTVSADGPSRSTEVHDLAIQHAQRVLDVMDSADAVDDPMAAKVEMEKLRELLRSITCITREPNNGEDGQQAKPLEAKAVQLRARAASADSETDRSELSQPLSEVHTQPLGRLGRVAAVEDLTEPSTRRDSFFFDDDTLGDTDENMSEWLNDMMHSGGGKTGELSNSMLCLAAASNDVEQLEQLVLEQGLQVDKGDYDCRTALHIAASEGFLVVVKSLVAGLGANTSPVDRWGNTPLDEAVRSKKHDVVAYLKEVGAKRGKGSQNADPLADLLNLAAKGEVDSIRLLAENCYDLDVNASDYDKRTAVHLAASEGRLEVIQLLIDELGASPSPEDRWGGTPLDDAIRSGYDEVKEYLESKGAERGATGTYRRGTGAADPAADLCHAAATADVQKLRELVNDGGLNVNRGDYDKRTAIHLAASEGLLNVVQTLVEELGAAHSPIDRWGGTPLDDAIRSRAERVTSYLRSKGATRGSLQPTTVDNPNRNGFIVGEFLSSLPSGSNSIWVCPEAMKKVFNQELFAEELPDSMLAATEMAKVALDSFDGDMIKLHVQSGGHALLVMTLALLDHHNLFEELNLDRATMMRFLRAIETGYGDNKYHNSVHGADVALSTHLFFHKFGLLKRLSKTDIFSAIIGAVIHDFNHPGTTNAHESRALTDRAICHSDISTLEAHHLHSTFTLLRQPGLDIFESMKTEDRAECRKLIIGLVLATDLAKHMDTVKWLRNLANEKGFAKAQSFGEEGEWTSPLHDSKEIEVSRLLSIAVKWADLGHVCKNNELHRTWTALVTEEFYTLGDRERSLGLHPSPLCNRATDTNIPASQMGFFKFLCVPFYATVADLLDPKMTPWLRLKENYRAWKAEKIRNEQEALEAQPEEKSS